MTRVGINEAKILAKRLITAADECIRELDEDGRANAPVRNGKIKR